MKMTRDEYKEYARQRAPRTASSKNLISAFIIGGGICCFGQLLLNVYGALGLDEKSAGTAATVTLIFIGVLLTGLGLYDNIAKKAGAGTLVPVTGFANSVSAPALEFKSEGFVLGVGAKMFAIAGPVIVYGISASVVYGFIYWLTGLI